MANNTFLPTSFTATSSFQQLSTLLNTAGIDVSGGFVAAQDGYIRNNDTAIDLYIGQGTTSPTYYSTVGPKAAILFNAGMNPSLIWVKCASSTVSCDFVEGASAYTPPLINGVIGEVTATENVVPKVDADANLVASSITDDGTTVTATEPIVSAHATTPYFETASGKTNTGYVNVKGKTSGSIKIKPADATGQVVTVATAAQTVGAATVTIPDLASVSDTFVFTTLAQELASKTMTAQVVKTGLTASGSASNDFSSSTGTFKTSSGANTLSGSVTVADATTPSITTASGKTNTGFLQINGKTSGSTKIITADSTAQAVVISTAAQTVGGCTLTIPDQTGNSTSFLFANQLLRGYVASDVTYNNTAALAAVAGMSVTVVDGGIYAINLVVQSTNAVKAPLFDFGGTVTPASFLGWWSATVSDGSYITPSQVTAIGTTYTGVGADGDSPNIWTFTGSLEVTTGGTFLLRGAQNAADASNTVILRGSSMILTRIG